MGGKIVKLISLNIKKLYGCYTYNVKFNTDVTFIYGANGCGKTTILNITEAIITGKLFKLFNYNFEEIKLGYVKNENLSDIKYIVIKLRKSKLDIKFNNQNYNIEIDIFFEGIRPPSRNFINITRAYFKNYNFLSEIKNTFNYVYLPLNRSNILYKHDNEYDMKVPKFHPVHNFLDEETAFISETCDIAMSQIEALIYNEQSRINSKVSAINDMFRNDILKSLLEIRQNYDITNMIKEILQQNILSDLQKTKTAYIKVLKELKLLDDLEENTKYNSFFEDLINDYKSIQKNESENLSADFILRFQEISKIKNLLDIAGKMEQQKTKIRRPIEIFKSTMNEFIGDSDEEKQIKIDAIGKIFFTTKYSKDKIEIQYLSSGEKQLLTFFANLIFKVRSNSSGIFVVDEPELSLHLSWQKIFVEKALEINNNIQLIFATHAPEIIGKNRNKMYKLEREYKKGEGENG